MKILIISNGDDALTLAHKMTKEGHTVELFTQQAGYESAGTGLYERVNAWRPRVEHVDFVLSTVPSPAVVDSLRRLGRPFLSLTNEMFLQKVAESSGFMFPTEYLFADALHMEFPDTGYSVRYGTKTFHIDSMNMIRSMAAGQFPPPAVTVRPEGVPLTCQGWFNGREWSKPFYITLKVSERNMSGVVTYAYWGPNKLVDYLLQMTPALKAEGYKGPVTMEFAVTEGGEELLHCTDLLDPLQVSALGEGCRRDSFNLFYDAALGTDINVNFTKDYVGAIEVTPSFNRHDPFIFALPIEPLTPDSLAHINLGNVTMQNDSCMAGSYNQTSPAIHVTAHGQTLDQTFNRMYRTIRRLNNTYLDYPIGLGHKAEKLVDTLKSWGYF